ncbi:MAG: hypothetical protein K2M57_07975 [Paramuribaculum sp.]|nr:hypothetical protein [Paramuribaculum sp.]
MKHVILLFIALLTAVGPVCAQKNVSAANEIIRKLNADNAVTSVYMAEGMMAKARYMLNLKFGSDPVGVGGAFLPTYPVDMKFMQLYTGEGESSRNLLKELVEVLVNIDPRETELLGKVKVLKKTTSIIGIWEAPKKVPDDPRKFLTIIYFVQEANSTTLVICGGDQLNEVFTQMLGTSSYID